MLCLDHDRQEPDGLSGSRGNGGTGAHTRFSEIERDLSTQNHSCGHRACDLASGRGARLLAGRTSRGNPDRYGLAEQPHAPVRREREVLLVKPCSTTSTWRSRTRASASARSSRARRSPGSSTSTTSATPGSTRSSWKRPWSQSRRSSIPAASKGRGRVRPRIAAASGAMPSSSKRSADPKHADHEK